MSALSEREKENSGATQESSAEGARLQYAARQRRKVVLKMIRRNFLQMRIMAGRIWWLDGRGPEAAWRGVLGS